MILLDEHGTVTETSTHAHTWLADITDPGTVPSVLRAVVAAAWAASTATETEDVPGSAHARLPRRNGGWVHLQATVLRDSRRVAVVVELAVEIHLSDVLVRAYNLTAREREITELVVRGYSTTEIASWLFISAYTVQDHLKNILTKAQVANRRELVAALHGRHYAPAARTGALPSPYGWYLPTTTGSGPDVLQVGQ